jgi:hypothetical protein
MMTPKEIASRFKVATKTVIAWINLGDLKAINTSRSLASKKPRWRVSQEALEAFEKTQSMVNASAIPAKRNRRLASDDEALIFPRRKATVGRGC